MELGRAYGNPDTISSEEASDYALRLAPFFSALRRVPYSPLFPQEKAEQFKVTASRYSAYLAWEYFA